MFLGEYIHTIDAKGRLSIPAAFRQQTLDGINLTMGFDGCLNGYPKETFRKLADSAASNSLGNPASRALNRALFSRAADLNYDSAGRILIPSNLRKLANLNGEVIVAGSGDYFEIWSPEAWEKQVAAIDDPEAQDDRWAMFNISTRGE